LFCEPIASKAYADTSLTDELFGDQVYGMDKGLKTIFKNFISSNVFQNYKTPSSVVRATGGNKREISSAAEILPVVVQPVTPQPAEPNPVNPAPAGSISSLANSGECTVVASTLSDARSKFEDQCRNQRREDCDQIRGQWLCSNISEPKQATPERQL